MRRYALLSTIDAGDPVGGLGERAPRPEETAKREAEIAAKAAAERKAYSFEKIVHATEKQMRDEAGASGSIQSKFRGDEEVSAFFDCYGFTEFSRKSLRSLSVVCRMTERQFISGLTFRKKIGSLVTFQRGSSMIPYTFVCKPDSPSPINPGA
jgi:hypothetical protein